MATGGLVYYHAGIGKYRVHTHPLTNCLILKHAFCLFLVSLAQICSQLIHIVNLYTCSAHWRFLYFHGETHARLIQDQSVYDKPKRERSLLITLLSPLLFLAPDAYLREMEKLWTDEIIKVSDWRRFIAKLLTQWENVILWVKFSSLYD